MSGTKFRFADWGSNTVPATPGVYVIWRGIEFLYVGMAGRGIVAPLPGGDKLVATRSRGLLGRLSSHASGRRSGDQFCVYVADRLLLPRLSRKQVNDIAVGAVSMDSLVRELVRTEFTYSFTSTSDGRSAETIERTIKAEGLPGIGRPFLNPGSAPD